MRVSFYTRKNKKFDSIYADIYYGNGKRKQVKIGKIYPDETNPEVKKNNMLVMQKVVEFEQIIKSTNNPYSFASATYYDLNSDFLQYFQILAEKATESNQQYISSIGHFKKFLESRSGKLKPLPFKDMSAALAKDYHDYLFENAISRNNKKLANNTALAYFEKFSSVLNHAVEENIIMKNPVLKMKDRRKYRQTQRSYLSVAEIDLVERTPCPHNILRRAFLFGCHTGLRFGDIKNLRVKDVYSVGLGEFECSIRMQKTDDPIAIPLNNKAFALIKDELGRDPEERVFHGLSYNQSNIIIQQWITDAGIYKKITFHNSRHSFASNLINRNVSMAHVKHLLGHKSISTTEIYAKSSAGVLREAVQKLTT
ncbi:tyrosine-type recombinase/integrase [Rufibacter glacialis]|uniref:Site-specific integrase n=1 Tax=Rufibacter glacialis TaxID=1259555 RepID=A0A5M8QBP9_9BACT|nr:site-specific integrase [Rufibacter glacialis]KAA6431912.1 site-specific integrase [Rufibacter glacialis]GGK80473.1 tyrosine recombinase [Rufibacter glacialis]